MTNCGIRYWNGFMTARTARLTSFRMIYHSLVPPRKSPGHLSWSASRQAVDNIAGLIVTYALASEETLPIFLIDSDSRL
jgi:hypothetical protein